MKKAFIIALICLAVALAGIVFIRIQEKTKTPLTPEQERYCEQVKQWRSQEMLGVSNAFRSGHPDMRGKYSEWCQGR